MAEPSARQHRLWYSTGRVLNCSHAGSARLARCAVVYTVLLWDFHTCDSLSLSLSLSLSRSRPLSLSSTTFRFSHFSIGFGVLFSFFFLQGFPVHPGDPGGAAFMFDAGGFQV